MDKLRLYDNKIGKFGFHKNGDGLGVKAYQVRYGSLSVDEFLDIVWPIVLDIVRYNLIAQLKMFIFISGTFTFNFSYSVPNLRL